MKRFLIIICSAVLLTSCYSQKRALYLQDLDTEAIAEIAESYQIRLKPLDRITVVVNSSRPELAAPFNTSSSYNSLTGVSIDGRNITSTSQSALQVLTLDEQARLHMPIIGVVVCAGKTRSQAAREIETKIKESGYLTDPSVNIQFADLYFSVIGEVNHPGRFEIVTDRVSLFDALSMAGDLTIFGQRKDVTVIREEDGQRTSTQLDLTSQDIFTSPYFYLQQNDVVYVKPNKYKAQTGEYNQNRSFYISLASTAIAVATLIVTCTR